MNGTKALVIVSHTLSVRKSRDSLERLAEYLREALPEFLVAAGYLCDAEQNSSGGRSRIETVIADLAAAGISETILFPYFLHYGIHVTRELPAKVRQFRKTWPDVKFILLEPLGSRPELSGLIAAQVTGCLI